MKLIIIITSVIVLISCSKSENKIDLEKKTLLTNGNWNRKSMKVNPKVFLTKLDNSGEFYTISDLMEIENIEEYNRNFRGYYKFEKENRYSFISNDKTLNIIRREPIL